MTIAFLMTMTTANRPISTEKDCYGHHVTDDFDLAAHSPDQVVIWHNKNGLRHHDMVRIIDDKAVVVTNFGKGRYLLIPDNELPGPPQVTENHFQLLEKLI